MDKSAKLKCEVLSINRKKHNFSDKITKNRSNDSLEASFQGSRRVNSPPSLSNFRLDISQPNSSKNSERNQKLTVLQG